VTATQVKIDPRLHDAVIIKVPQSDSVPDLQQRLHAAGVETTILGREVTDSHELREAARTLGSRAERSVVVDTEADGILAARNAGFSMVIGVGPAERSDELTQRGADAVVADLADIGVRTGDRRMSEIPDALASYEQVVGIIDGRVPAVCLDYDGTLSPIVGDPDSARLVDGAAEALERLSRRCPVAILSGRDLTDVRTRIAVPGIWYAGSHGFESVAPDGSYRQNEEAAAAVPVLQRAASELREVLAHIKGTRVEHKRFAVAVHYRDVEADLIGEVVANTYRMGAREHLRVTNGRKVIELRPDVDWNKGTTLAWIRDQIEGAEKVLPIYIGDDLTDEDGFDAVRDDGIGVLVRHNEDGDRRSSATFTVESPEQVRELLDRFADDVPSQPS
jgi:trehalose-phosphatase